MSSFTKSNDLPSELRLKIWKAAAFIPRAVDVWCKDINLGRRRRFRRRHYKILSRTRPPAILWTCRESRNEGLKHYALEFGTTKDFGDLVVVSKPRTYINPSVDTIYLPRPYHFIPFRQGNDDPRDLSDKAFDLADTIRRLGVLDLAVNLASDSGEEYCEIIIFVQHIMPKIMGSIGELILFSDFKCKYDSRWLSYDGVKFNQLKSGEEHDSLSRDASFLGEQLVTEWNHSFPAMDAQEKWQTYEGLKKRFCSLEGTW